jgi:hypothetical protein
MIVGQNGRYLAKTAHDHGTQPGLVGDSFPKLAMIVEAGGGR